MHAVIQRRTYGKISDSLAGKACMSDSALDIHVDIKVWQYSWELHSAYGVQESLGRWRRAKFKEVYISACGSPTTDAPVTAWDPFRSGLARLQRMFTD